MSFSSGDEDDSADWWKAADYLPKRPMNIELSPENAAVVAYYAQILGCSESEFPNRYLEIHVDEYSGDCWESVNAMEELKLSTFKSYEEAQRVLEWFCRTLKADALSSVKKR